MVTLRYFASIREALGKQSESADVPTPATVAALLDALRAKGGAYAEALSTTRRWRVAVNQDMVGLDAAIGPGDEVAIFPPVTGG